MVWLFLAGPFGWIGLLEDGDTGWHIRTGEYILDHGRVPREDLFSFSKPGAPWYAWEWLADVLDAVLYRTSGFKGIVFLAGVSIGLFATLLLRYSVWRGASVVVVLPVILFSVGASSLHFLARPHLFTLLFLAIAVWLVEIDRRHQTSRVWLLVPLTALWTNLHGGFLVLFVFGGLLVTGLAIEILLGFRTGWQRLVRYCTLFTACAAASLLNPYGWLLHVHAIEYLQSDWIRNTIQEFQAPNFREEGQIQFEAMLLVSLALVGILLRNRKVTEALWILAFSHLALNSARHITMFVIVCGPVLAAETTEAWRWLAERAGPRSVAGVLEAMAVELGPSFRRSSIWSTVFVIWLWIGGGQVVAWPTDFPSQVFPTAMIAKHGELLVKSRVLTKDQWADYMIFRGYPRQKVFVDGRSDFYGPEFGDPYLHMTGGQWNWAKILEQQRFDVVLAPPEWPLTSLLKLDPRWQLADDDHRAVLFIRRP